VEPGQALLDQRIAPVSPVVEGRIAFADVVDDDEPHKQGRKKRARRDDEHVSRGHRRRRSGMGIASAILGITGFLLCMLGQWMWDDWWNKLNPTEREIYLEMQRGELPKNFYIFPLEHSGLFVDIGLLLVLVGCMLAGLSFIPKRLRHWNIAACIMNALALFLVLLCSPSAAAVVRKGVEHALRGISRLLEG
jgi:hypothetical protein